jgi:hypothetical protein
MEKPEDGGTASTLTWAQLPLELGVYIFSLLDQKAFLNASFVCRQWRTAAFIAADHKSLNLFCAKLTQEAVHTLLNLPFSIFVFRYCLDRWKGLAPHQMHRLQSPRLQLVHLRARLKSMITITRTGRG